ncbi:Bacterial type II/III secretion system short domain protein [Botrimarina colliarenosi]|uniref:Bacterial type II/III secretion system short domain protein n=1 Tax=Botrimarina colliarenosi TaxID=2528001 RepID=A0A5C6AIV0_9BACT|nr:secretin N-terminal domain-containing protein [Botrimarina colliarenosi]TWT99168.1 Bacterial type II/III secretion system short domain protein [Botrimarina colliarenosi]
MFARALKAHLAVALTFALFFGVTASESAYGQYGDAIPAGVPPEIRAKIEAARRQRGAPSPAPQEEKKEDEKAEEKKEDDKEKKEDKADDKKDGPVKRSSEPPKPPDPRELEAKPDASGRITFSFNGQAWADVLQWLANVSNLSLDWRELPSDYLNLTTQRAYSIDEARDLINRHLQARGYALLLSGEVLSVIKLDAVDPSLVPRVTEEELYDRQPHDLVKLSLELPPDLDVKQASEDVKQALSPHAKVMPLTATKRLLLIDTVANLRMVSALLNNERLAAEGREVPREFVLRYIQAASVIDTLYVVLGLDPNSRPSQMELQMQQQKMQLMQQLAQSGKDVVRLLQKDGPPVYLAYNRQRNSVLANAPPEQMRIIERTIESLDVPAGGANAASADAAAGPVDRSLEQYRLKTIDPQAVISALEEIGNLSPLAELRGDKESKTIFARATDADHKKIASLIEQLDGAETLVEVFWLRRLPAEAVAGSIESLIINQPKKKKKSNDNPYFFSFRNNNNDDDDEPETILRVDADIENNRLIVRGTPQQLDEVRDLLVKLGEPIGEAEDRRRVRVLDSLDPEATERLIDQLKQAWPAVGGETELIVPPPAAEKAPEEEEESDADSAPAKVATVTRGGSPFHLLANTTGPMDGADDTTSAPVTVQVDPRGRIVISSDDTAALDRLEELASELAPAPARYEVFHVKNRTPDDIVINLEIYFKDFLAEDDDQVVDWWGRIRGVKSEDDEPVRLSKRMPLRFLADDWSSSILVANATSAQLREIQRLIDAWDRQPVADRILTRRTVTVKLRYAKASVVVSALKDVYRDLLSKGDREFDTEEQKAKGAATRYLTRIQHGAGDPTEPAGIPFGGILSLGSDDAANVVVISARNEVFDSVLETIEDIDQQARPTTTVQVMQLEGGVASNEVRQALARALTAQGTMPPPENRGDQRGGGDRRRDRGDRGRGRR